MGPPRFTYAEAYCDAQRIPSSVLRTRHDLAGDSSGAVIRDDVRPFVGVRARDNRNDRLTVAEVEDFVWNSGLDVDEVTGAVLDGLLQMVAKLMPHAPAEDVEHYLEPDVHMRKRDGAWRHG